MKKSEDPKGKKPDSRSGQPSHGQQEKPPHDPNFFITEQTVGFIHELERAGKRDEEEKKLQKQKSKELHRPVSPELSMRARLTSLEAVQHHTMTIKDKSWEVGFGDSRGDLVISPPTTMMPPPRKRGKSIEEDAEEFKQRLKDAELKKTHPREMFLPGAIKHAPYIRPPIRRDSIPPEEPTGDTIAQKHVSAPKMLGEAKPRRLSFEDREKQRRHSLTSADLLFIENIKSAPIVKELEEVEEKMRREKLHPTEHFKPVHTSDKTVQLERLRRLMPGFAPPPPPPPPLVQPKTTTPVGKSSKPKTDVVAKKPIPPVPLLWGGIFSKPKTPTKSAGITEPKVPPAPVVVKTSPRTPIRKDSLPPEEPVVTPVAKSAEKFKSRPIQPLMPHPKPEVEELIEIPKIPEEKKAEPQQHVPTQRKISLPKSKELLVQPAAKQPRRSLTPPIQEHVEQPILTGPTIPKRPSISIPPPLQERKRSEAKSEEPVVEKLVEIPAIHAMADGAMEEKMKPVGTIRKPSLPKSKSKELPAKPQGQKPMAPLSILDAKVKVAEEPERRPSIKRDSLPTEEPVVPPPSPVLEQLVEMPKIPVETAVTKPEKKPVAKERKPSITKSGELPAKPQQPRKSVTLPAHPSQDLKAKGEEPPPIRRDSHPPEEPAVDIQKHVFTKPRRLSLEEREKQRRQSKSSADLQFTDKPAALIVKELEEMEQEKLRPPEYRQPVEEKRVSAEKMEIPAETLAEIQTEIKRPDATIRKPSLPTKTQPRKSLTPLEHPTQVIEVKVDEELGPAFILKKPSVDEQTKPPLQERKASEAKPEEPVKKKSVEEKLVETPEIPVRVEATDRKTSLPKAQPRKSLTPPAHPIPEIKVKSVEELGPVGGFILKKPSLTEKPVTKEPEIEKPIEEKVVETPEIPAEIPGKVDETKVETKEPVSTDRKISLPKSEPKKSITPPVQPVPEIKVEEPAPEPPIKRDSLPPVKPVVPVVVIEAEETESKKPDAKDKKASLPKPIENIVEPPKIEVQTPAKVETTEPVSTVKKISLPKELPAKSEPKKSVTPPAKPAQDVKVKGPAPVSPTLKKPSLPEKPVTKDAKKEGPVVKKVEPPKIVAKTPAKVETKKPIATDKKISLPPKPPSGKPVQEVKFKADEEPASILKKPPIHEKSDTKEADHEKHGIVKWMDKAHHLHPSTSSQSLNQSKFTLKHLAAVQGAVSVMQSQKLKRADILNLTEHGIPAQKKLLKSLLPSDYMAFDFGGYIRDYYSHVLHGPCLTNSQERYRSVENTSACLDAIDMSDIGSKDEQSVKEQMRKLDARDKLMDRLRLVAVDEEHFEYLKNLANDQTVTVPITVIHGLMIDILPIFEEIYRYYSKCLGANHKSTLEAGYHYVKMKNRMTMYANM